MKRDNPNVEVIARRIAEARAKLGMARAIGERQCARCEGPFLAHTQTKRERLDGVTLYICEGCER